MKKNILKNNGVQSLLASLVCVILGLLIGYIVLLFINPDGAGEAITDVMKNFLTYSKPETQVKYLGNTLVKTAPLLMCSLSILFAYKVGLFNIGASGQYCIGVALSLYAALAWGWSWLPCMLLAMLGGALLGAISGLLKVLLQRQRGHLRHHAELDRPLPDQHAPHAGEGGHQSPTPSCCPIRTPRPSCPLWGSPSTSVPPPCSLPCSRVWQTLRTPPSWRSSTGPATSIT